MLEPLILVSTLLISPVPAEQPSLHMPSGQVLHLELAVTPEERGVGLMFRESIPDNSGMFFVFERCGVHTFWMKNCFFPIDIVWLDRKGTVVKILYDLPPCREKNCPHYSPDTDACYAIEVNAGMAEKLGITERGSLPIQGVIDYVKKTR